MSSEKIQNLTNYFKNIVQNDDETRTNFLKDYTIDQLEKLDIFKSSKKLYERLKMVVNNENLYEADQLYKTIHFRCMNNNLSDDGLSILFNGIIFFADKKSLQCAYDLAKAFLETLKKSSRAELDSKLRYQIKCIHEYLGKCRSSNDEERTEFSVAVLKWSSSLFVKNKLDVNNELSVHLNYQSVFGHYDIHNDFAFNYWKERNYVQARYHFLHSLDAKSFAFMIIQCHLNFGYPSEYDLFLAQGVFQFLTLRNLKSAEELFHVYTENHPQINKCKKFENFYESPLLNFMYFLIVTIKEKKYKEYKEILKAYKPFVEIDSSFQMYLEKIDEFFFDVKPVKKESGGIFSNLMRMLTSNGMPSESSTRAKSSRQQYVDSDEEDSHSLGYLEDNELLD
ncbi:unnamed protein product [Brachionus calyciflorus]|uniref:Uncharacterized protein n=1 Tax=Brachionus calyciflorus TaxID=104777 RepID=A0A814F9F8_9BILA|nr:unnamed protein product [Brachionus calyciflorus]